MEAISDQTSSFQNTAFVFLSKVAFSLCSNLEDLHKVESLNAVPFPVGLGTERLRDHSNHQASSFHVIADCPRTHIHSNYRILFSKTNTLSFLQSTKIVQISVKLLTIHISSLMNHSLDSTSVCLQSVAQCSSCFICTPSKEGGLG